MSRIKQKPEEIRKVTVNLPASLLEGLDEERGLTEVLRLALEQYRRDRAYEILQALRGTGGLMALEEGE